MSTENKIEMTNEQPIEATIVDPSAAPHSLVYCDGCGTLGRLHALRRDGTTWRGVFCDECRKAIDAAVDAAIGEIHSRRLEREIKGAFGDS